MFLFEQIQCSGHFARLACKWVETFDDDVTLTQKVPVKNPSFTSISVVEPLGGSVSSLYTPI